MAQIVAERAWAVAYTPTASVFSFLFSVFCFR
jgi:hypothetical protein